MPRMQHLSAHVLPTASASSMRAARIEARKKLPRNLHGMLQLTNWCSRALERRKTFLPHDMAPRNLLWCHEQQAVVLIHFEHLNYTIHARRANIDHSYTQASSTPHAGIRSHPSGAARGIQRHPHTGRCNESRALGRKLTTSRFWHRSGGYPWSVLDRTPFSTDGASNGIKNAICPVSIATCAAASSVGASRCLLMRRRLVKRTTSGRLIRSPNGSD